MVEAGVRRVAAGVAAAFGVKATIEYQRRYPATVNTAAETEVAARVAADVAGPAAVRRDMPPSMVSEDFAFLLQARPGCYACIGNGPDEEGRGLHSPRYEFNDEILAVGAAYWARLAETVLSP